MFKKLFLPFVLCGMYSPVILAYPSWGDISSKVLSELMHTGSIIGGATLAAMTYGVLNDMVTARICLPYFTRGFHEHNLQRWDGPILGRLKRILEKYENSPTVIASIWGPVATLCLGLPLGILSAICARFPLGNLPQLTLEDLQYPLLGAIVATGLCAAYGGVKTSFQVAQIEDPETLRHNGFNNRVPTEQLKNFQICSGIHYAAYQYGPFAGLAVGAWIVAKRLGMF